MSVTETTFAADGHAVASHAVVTSGLTKRYGDATALDGVDLRVPEGAIFVLVGANGAGKSTTLKLLLNLERPDAGTAQVFGLDTRLAGPEARAQIGYVPEQHETINRWMTCGQLLGHVATYYPSWDDAYAGHLVRAFSIRLEQKIRGLSKGETRRLQLILALAHRPPLLLLDEPTDGLDPIVRRRVLTLLAEHLADSPTTVVVSTHHINEMEGLADHVGVLSEGRLVAQMGRDELHRTVRRYRLTVPETWTAPSGLQVIGLRRSRAGRDVECTIVGDERDVSSRLTQSGAQVHDVTSIGLEDAALAFLPEEVAS